HHGYDPRYYCLDEGTPQTDRWPAQMGRNPLGDYSGSWGPGSYGGYQHDRDRGIHQDGGVGLYGPWPPDERPKAAVRDVGCESFAGCNTGYFHCALSSVSPL